MVPAMAMPEGTSGGVQTNQNAAFATKPRCTGSTTTGPPAHTGQHVKTPVPALKIVLLSTSSLSYFLP